MGDQWRGRARSELQAKDGHDDRGNLRERSVERQPESRGARLLLVLNITVHPLFESQEVASVWGAGGQKRIREVCDLGRLYSFSPGH